MNRLRDPASILILIFLGMIAAVPFIQWVIEARQDEGIRVLEVFRQAPTAANLRAYERSLESANWAARVTRPWFQYAQFKWLKEGGEKAVIGAKGWYFYKPGLNYMLARPQRAKQSGPTNDPLPAILDYRDQLAALGIRLVVMPVPNKESIYPERAAARAPGRGELAPSTRDLLEKLRAANVEFIDLFKEFGEARPQPGSTSQGSLYLAQDTHWSPWGVSVAAAAAARRLRELGLVQPGEVDYSERPAPVQRFGDILRMLRVPEIERRVNPERVPCLQVVRRDNGELYKDAPEAEILVLGDSFVRVYQQDEPGGAGFIGHLAK
jgi:alginate O-acetyltransferase complex protein AlgJ